MKNNQVNQELERFRTTFPLYKVSVGDNVLVYKVQNHKQVKAEVRRAWNYILEGGLLLKVVDPAGEYPLSTHNTFLVQPIIS